MEILIEQIPEDGLELKFEKSVSTFPVLTEMVTNGECDFKVPIRTALRALHIGEIIEIEGDVASTVWLPCSRCLKPFETSLNSHFSLTYMRQPVASVEDDESREIELNAEDMGMVYFQGDKINLIDTIQEQVLMEFPLRILCKHDCKGLCPNCGADLNETPCDCNPNPSTGKFDALKSLKIEN